MNKQIITPNVFAELPYTAQVASVKGELVKPVLPASQPDDTAKLRSRLSGQFGIRLESTGARALSGPITLILMQTLDASPTNPYLVTFDQHIFDPFTGPGQFELVERDSSDVEDGDSQAAIATHSDGFTNGITNEAGWSHFEKPITSDKIYSVVFVPGTAGDGIYSIKVRALIPLDADHTPLPS